jgi:hypothetical protein
VAQMRPVSAASSRLPKLEVAVLDAPPAQQHDRGHAETIAKQGIFARWRVETGARAHLASKLLEATTWSTASIADAIGKRN